MPQLYFGYNLGHGYVFLLNFHSPSSLVNFSNTSTSSSLKKGGVRNELYIKRTSLQCCLKASFGSESNLSIRTCGFLLAICRATYLKYSNCASIGSSSTRVKHFVVIAQSTAIVLPILLYTLKRVSGLRVQDLSMRVLYSLPRSSYYRCFAADSVLIQW